MQDDSDRPFAGRGLRSRSHAEGSAGTATAGLLVLSETECYVGDTITLKGRNLPTDTSIRVVWHSVTGEWGVLQANRIVGPQYRPRTDHLFTIDTDANGRFDEDWTVPQDYGGTHKLELQNEAGETLATTELRIIPWFSIDRTTVPLGDTFQITGYGLGPSVVQTNYQVAWDNGYVGFMTGVQNRGTATATLRAVGPPGDHLIQIWRNFRGAPQVQSLDQSPHGPVGGNRPSKWTVEVTEREDEPQRSRVEGILPETPIALHYPDIDAETDAELSVEPTSGQAGSEAVLRGSGFPPNTDVNLVWYRHEGSHVRGIPVTPEPRWGVLPTVETDEDGAFSIPFTVPQAEGSTRPIVAVVNGQSVAVTGYVVQPSIESFTPQSGPAGTEIEIELGGLGWTMFENAYHVLYDNRPLGYVSGTIDDAPGSTSKIVLEAVGEPGYHFIDIYPGIYEMEDDTPEFELKPHLSYLDNHPVRPLPSIHLVFEVEN